LLFASSTRFRYSIEGSLLVLFQDLVDALPASAVHKATVCQNDVLHACHHLIEHVFRISILSMPDPALSSIVRKGIPRSAQMGTATVTWQCEVGLLVYPADWEPVSTDQLGSYNGALPQIRSLGAELVGISVDGIWCHQAFAENLGLRFPLLADTHPHGAPARAYGVYRRRDDVSCAGHLCDRR
jgi:AhpC/TSA family protein